MIAQRYRVATAATMNCRCNRSLGKCRERIRCMFQPTLEYRSSSIGTEASEPHRNDCADNDRGCDQMSPETSVRRCPYCDEEIRLTAKKCKHCGEFLDASQRDEATDRKQAADVAQSARQMFESASENIRKYRSGRSDLSWNPGVAAVLSFFVPGAGQIYKGEVGRGFLTFLAFIVGLFLLVVPGLVIWVWAVLDAAGRTPREV